MRNCRFGGVLVDVTATGRIQVTKEESSTSRKDRGRHQSRQQAVASGRETWDSLASQRPGKGCLLGGRGQAAHMLQSFQGDKLIPLDSVTMRSSVTLRNKFQPSGWDGNLGSEKLISGSKEAGTASGDEFFGEYVKERKV